MTVETAQLALMRPGMRVEDLRAACGQNWEEPSADSEGFYLGKDLGARIAIDGRIGAVSFRKTLELPEPINGISFGMPADAFDRLYPDASHAPDEREKYGWRIMTVSLSPVLTMTVGIREGAVGVIELADPSAVYPERPYKHANPSLTEAFDLNLADPVNLKTRPKNGWCFGRPPGINGAAWPLSPENGLPLRHAFTLRLPEQYRTLGKDYVAISLFVDEQFETPAKSTGVVANGVRTSSPRRFDMNYMDCTYSLFWLTEAEFAAPLGSPPAMTGGTGPSWLTKTPLAYFGEFEVPSSQAERLRRAKRTAKPSPLSKLINAILPKTGWRHRRGLKGLNFGWPIEITRREGDPNIGKPAREFSHQSEASGYITAYSDEGQALGLERFEKCHAHLGGTMFPIQGYPSFSPYVLELNEVFGGFNFGSGIAQLDLEQMLIEWAC